MTIKNPPDQKEKIIGQEDLKESAQRFTEFFEEIQGNIKERDNLMTQIQLALIEHQHVLQFGSPGEGKSMVINDVLARITSKDNPNLMFRKILGPETQAQEILGPINYKILSEQGRLQYSWEDGIGGKNVRYVELDEILDANPIILRQALLNALNKEPIKAGATAQETKLKITVGGTNKTIEDALQESSGNISALLERILYKYYVTRVKHSENKDAAAWATMAKSNAQVNARRDNQGENLSEDITGLSIEGDINRKKLTKELFTEDIDRFSMLLEHVSVPTEILHAVDTVSKNYQEKTAEKQKKKKMSFSYRKK